MIVKRSPAVMRHAHSTLPTLRCSLLSRGELLRGLWYHSSALTTTFRGGRMEYVLCQLIQCLNSKKIYAFRKSNLEKWIALDIERVVAACSSMRMMPSIVSSRGAALASSNAIKAGCSTGQRF